MPHALSSHPATRPPTEIGLTVSLASGRSSLQLCFRAACGPGLLRLPPATEAPSFTDGLWQHTCFELFAAAPGGTAYREFNFAPSGHWAAYAFSGYRERLDWQPASAPLIRCMQAAEALEVQVELPRALLPDSAVLALGLSAVLEHADGTLDYRALRHTAERPDFHRRDAFILELDLDASAP